MNAQTFLPFLISLSFALIALPIAIKVGHKLNLLDHPGRHKRHKHPVPYLGGTVLFLSFWFAMTAASLFDNGPAIEPLGALPWMFGASFAIYLVGLIDDLVPIAATTKLFVQIVAGLLLYFGGLEVDRIFVPFFGELTLSHWSALITVLWVVGLTNAMNLIDGLDGLAAGVSLIAAIVLAGLGVLYQLPSVIAVATALIGFLVAFLHYNKYPARIFLGDSGSLQIGFYFAVISLLVPFKSYAAAALYLPLLTLGVPILETLVSIVRRLASGKKVMRADRRHLFHYLALAGLSPRKTVYIFYFLSSVFGLSAVAMFLWDRVLVSILLGVFMVVIFSLFLIFISNVPRAKKNGSGAE